MKNKKKVEKKKEYVDVDEYGRVISELVDKINGLYEEIKNLRKELAIERFKRQDLEISYEQALHEKRLWHATTYSLVRETMEGVKEMAQVIVTAPSREINIIGAEKLTKAMAEGFFKRLDKVVEKIPEDERERIRNEILEEIKLITRELPKRKVEVKPPEEKEKGAEK